MLMRTIALILLAFTVSGCGRVRPPDTTAIDRNAPLPAVKQTHPMKALSQINVRGGIDVSLHTGYSHPELILTGDPRDLAQVSIIQGSTVFISVGKGAPRFGPIKAVINSQRLHSFTYEGAGNITGSRLHTGSLDLAIKNAGRTMLGGNIYLERLRVAGPGFTQIDGVSSQSLRLIMTGSPKVKLSGIFNLSNLDLRGDGWVGMYWIKSGNLRITARGKSFIQLGGVAQRMDVELWDKARFNGRYLRAARAFVKTHDRSVAEISSLDRQHTLATDASDIYFYNIPRMKTDFMAYDGSVLDMREWYAYAQEYDNYNKW